MPLQLWQRWCGIERYKSIMKDGTGKQCTRDQVQCNQCGGKPPCPCGHPFLGHVSRQNTSAKAENQSTNKDVNPSGVNWVHSVLNISRSDTNRKDQGVGQGGATKCHARTWMCARANQMPTLVETPLTASMCAIIRRSRAQIRPRV